MIVVSSLDRTAGDANNGFIPLPFTIAAGDYQAEIILRNQLLNQPEDAVFSGWSGHIAQPNDPPAIDVPVVAGNYDAFDMAALVPAIAELTSWNFNVITKRFDVTSTGDWSIATTDRFIGEKLGLNPELPPLGTRWVRQFSAGVEFTNVTNYIPFPAIYLVLSDQASGQNSSGDTAPSMAVTTNSDFGSNISSKGIIRKFERTSRLAYVWKHDPRTFGTIDIHSEWVLILHKILSTD